jgi:hypothetical protein
MCKVIINRTDTNFITSDNPVVFYNIAHEKALGNHIGLASKGLTIITQISPRHILIFYDGRSYKLGEKKRLYAYVNEKNDVFQFNDLQWLNSRENIYFDKTTPHSEILRGSQKNLKNRMTDKVNLDEHEEHIDNTKGRVFIHTYPAKLNFSLKLNCIKKIITIPESEMGDGTDLVRNPELIEFHREFLKEVDKGRYKASEGLRFINDKYQEQIFGSLITMQPKL